MSFIFSTIAYNKNLENQRNQLVEKTDQEQKQKLDQALNKTIRAKDLSKAQKGTLVFDIILITAITVLAALIIANHAHTIDLPNLGTMSNQAAYIMIGVSAGLLLTDLITLCIHQSKHNARRQKAFKTRLEGLQRQISANKQKIKTAKKDVIENLGGVGGMDNVDVVNSLHNLLHKEQERVKTLETQREEEQAAKTKFLEENKQLKEQARTQTKRVKEISEQLERLTKVEQALQQQLNDQSLIASEAVIRSQGSNRKVAEQEEALKRLREEMAVLKDGNSSQRMDTQIEQKMKELAQIEEQLQKAKESLQSVEETAAKLRTNSVEEVKQGSTAITKQKKEIETHKATIATLQAEIAALELQKQEATKQQLQAAADELSKGFVQVPQVPTKMAPPPPMPPPLLIPTQSSHANRPIRAAQERKGAGAPAPAGPPQVASIAQMKKNIANNNAPHFPEDAKKALQNMVTDPNKKEELIRFSALLVDIRNYLTGKQDASLTHSSLSPAPADANSIAPVLDQYKLPEALEQYFYTLREFIHTGREDAVKGEKTTTVHARAKACEKRILDEIIPLIDEEQKDKREEIVTLENVLVNAFEKFRPDFEPVNDGEDDEEWSD